MVPARYSRPVSSLKIYLFAAAVIIMTRITPAELYWASGNQMVSVDGKAAIGRGGSWRG